MTANDLHPAHLRWNTLRRKVLFAAFVLAFVSFAFFRWILWPVKISGDSMIPNYVDGQPTYINKLAYWSAQPQRGDVVGIRTGSGELYIKRIIGLPGERIEFCRDTVIANGEALVERYQVKPLLWRLDPIQLSSAEYFVMGDNRSGSMLGPVSKNWIIGKAIF